MVIVLFNFGFLNLNCNCFFGVEILDFEVIFILYLFVLEFIVFFILERVIGFL